MASKTLFYIGVALDVFILIVSISNSFLMSSPVKSSDGTVYDTSDGLTAYGKLMSWLLPLVVAAFIGAGFFLKSKEKMTAANIVVWIPGLPMLAGLLIWGGLAAIFVLFSK